MTKKNFQNISREQIREQCSKTNSILLDQYVFFEKKEIVVRDNKEEEYRFLYLQLKPEIGILVDHYCHTWKYPEFQGFDMFMYNSDSVEKAIYQYLHKKTHNSLPKFRLLGIQSKLEQTQLILNQLIKEKGDDFLVVESQYETLSKEIYYAEGKNSDAICDLQEEP